MKESLAVMGAFVLVGTMAAYGYRALALPSQTTAIHHIVEVPEGAAFKEVANQNGLTIRPFCASWLATSLNAAPSGTSTM